MLEADSLFQDPRYKEGKKLLLAALEEHQKAIKGIKPANSGLTKSYAALLEKAAALRGAPLYFPYVGSGLGNGLLVELADGSVKYDLIDGVGTHFFGHSNIQVTSATIDAALQDIVMQGNLQQNSDSIALMDLLAKTAKMDHVFLSTSGVMACENALKVIFQKKFPASRVIAFDGCFMGRTLAGSQITDKPSFREGLPHTLDVSYIPFFDPEDPINSTKRSVEALKNHLARYPGEYAVLIMELVQGERGFYVGDTEFFKALIKVAKEANLAIFVDEVQTFGRTPKLFAFHYFELEHDVDVVSIGKVAQVAATFWKKDFNPKPGLLSQTFTSSTSAIRAALYLINSLVTSDLYGPKGKLVQLHQAFTERLAWQAPMLNGPYGIGAMVAFTPGDGDGKITAQFCQKLFANGVIGFIAGSNPTRCRFLLPAVAMGVNDIDPIMDIVIQTAKEIL